MRGYIYILSNPAYKNDLLKIGLTANDPRIRTRDLGRSTAAPSAFNLEYSVVVDDADLAERRIHLLLQEKRYRRNKEFFDISLNDAITTVEKVKLFQNASSGIEDAIRIRSVEIEAFHSQPIAAGDHGMLRLLMAATRGNDSLVNQKSLRPGIVDGFLSVSEVQDYLKCLNREQARRRMEAFAKRMHNHGVLVNFLKMLRIEIPRDQRVEVKTFDDLRYGGGQLAWCFSASYRSFFATGEHNSPHVVFAEDDGRQSSSRTIF